MFPIRQTECVFGLLSCTHGSSVLDLYGLSCFKWVLSLQNVHTRRARRRWIGKPALKWELPLQNEPTRRVRYEATCNSSLRHVMDAVSAILATRYSRRMFFSFKLRVAHLVMTQARDSRTIGTVVVRLTFCYWATWISFEHCEQRQLWSEEDEMNR